MPAKEIPQFEVYRRPQTGKFEQAKKEAAEPLKLQSAAETEAAPVLAKDFQSLFDLHRKGVLRKRENKRDVKALASIENRLIRLCVRNNPRNFDRTVVERIVNQYNQGVQRHFGTNFRFDSRELVDPVGVSSVVAYINRNQGIGERAEGTRDTPQRRFYLNDTLDAGYKVDLMDFQYMPSGDSVELQTCELVQVKSSVEEARLEEARIREAHEAWYNDWVEKEELEQQRAQTARLPERLQPLEQFDLSTWARQHGEVLDALMDLEDALEHGQVNPDELSRILHLTQKDQITLSQYARYKKKELLRLFEVTLSQIEAETSPGPETLERGEEMRERLAQAIALVATSVPDASIILGVKQVYSVIAVGDRVFSRKLIGPVISGKAVTAHNA